MLSKKLLNNEKYKILINYSFTTDYLFNKVYNFMLIQRKDGWTVRDTIFTKYELYEILVELRKN